MNLFLYPSQLLAARHDDADEWFAGEAWVNPQPFDIERFSVVDAPRAVDPANDWVPL